MILSFIQLDFYILLDNGLRYNVELISDCGIFEEKYQSKRNPVPNQNFIKNRM